MSVNLDKFQSIKQLAHTHKAALVAVSKIKPVSDIKILYDHGQ